MSAPDPLAALPVRRLVAGPLPPPVHGYAVAMQGLFRMLDEAGARPAALDLAASGAGLAYLGRRLWRTTRASARLLLERRLRGQPVRVHLGCDGGAGIVLTIALVLAARASGCLLRIHHHSKARISRPAPLLWLLIRLAGREAIHIVLRRPMAAAFHAAYGQKLQTHTLSNAAFVPVPKITPRPAGGDRRGQLTAGMLGNLCHEKGLDAFLALADAVGASEAAADIRLVLAGPVHRQRDAAAILRRVERGLLCWLGPLDERQKPADFYVRIDLLLFPSRHVHEAEPFVVLEAMAHGVVPVALNVGYIQDLVRDAAVLVPQHHDFAGAALEAIRRARADPRWLRRLQARARRRFLKEHAAALACASAVLELENTGPPFACNGRS